MPGGDSSLAIEVLIPHWNRADDLRAALTALSRQTFPVQVCVIDNGSTDHTGAVLREEFPDVRHLRLDRNYGFGTAVNRGIRESGAELVVLLNNDAIADESFVEEIVAAREGSGAEMVAACLRRPDGSVESLGVEVDRSLVTYDVAYGDPYDSGGHAALEPLAPSGGAAAFLRDAVLAVGGFDEAIFAYLEDVDLGIRMRMAGMRCVAAPRAVAWHRHSSTLGSGTEAKNRLMGRSRGHLIWKYGRNLSAWDRFRGRLMDSVVYSGQAVVDRNLGGPRGRRESWQAVAGAPSPPADQRFEGVPRARISLVQGLRRRLSRRWG
jgi:GT2 family glycosyltransferase